VLASIASATAIVLAPSNPITSLGPILAVPGIREALRLTAAPVAAISPIVGNKAVSGPAGALMAAEGLPVSIAGVARAYEQFLDVLIADRTDAQAAAELARSGVDVRCANTIMATSEDRVELARTVVAALELGHFSGMGAGPS
jgi:LPPG:FO 2-phospho-L-lactate transferase